MQRVFIGLFLTQIVKVNESQEDVTRDKCGPEAPLLSWRLNFQILFGYNLPKLQQNIIHFGFYGIFCTKHYIKLLYFYDL